MLTVKKRDGTYFTINRRLDSESIAKLRKDAPYYCACCDSRVILKAGAIKIPHFAHEKKNSCFVYSEPESEYHLLGKLKLFHWLSGQGIQVKVEEYLKEISQKADLYFEFKGEKFAIEFQCSVISEHLFIKRTASYKNAGIRPIWILSQQRVNQKLGGECRLSSFEWLFADGDPLAPWLLAFCPIHSSIHKIESILPFSTQKSFIQINIVPLDSISFIQLLKTSSSYSHSQIKNWLKKKKSWQLHSHRNASVDHPLYKEIYLRRLTPLTLPPVIGIPVPYCHSIETSPFIWQTFLYLDRLASLKKGEIFNVKVINDAFNKRLANGDVRKRVLPINPNPEHPYLAIQMFLEFLIKAGHLSRRESGEYRVTKEMLPCILDTERFQTEHKVLKALLSFYLEKA